MAKQDKTELAELKKLSEDVDFMQYFKDIVNMDMARTRMFGRIYADGIRAMFGHQAPPKEEQQEGWIYPSINVIMPAVWQDIALLVTKNFKVVGLPREDSDEESATTMSQILQAKWGTDDLKMILKIMQALLDGHLGTNFIGYWYWDKELKWDKKTNKYIGDIVTEVVNPTYFGADPDVELGVEVATKAKHCCMEFYIDKAEAAGRWEAYREYLVEHEKWDPIAKPYQQRSGGSDEYGGRTPVDEGNFDRSTNDWAGQVRGSTAYPEFGKRVADIITGAQRQGGVRIPDDANKVKIQILLAKNREMVHHAAGMDDYTIDEVKQGLASPLGYDDATLQFIDLEKPTVDEQGNVIGYDPWPDGKERPQKEIAEAYDAPKYPNGRWTICLDEKVLVEDQVYPYERWPFAVGSLYPLPHMWYGGNSVEPVLHLQEYLNQLHTHFLNAVRHHSDPQWKVETGSLAPDNENPEEAQAWVPNGAGSIIRVQVGKMSGVERQDPGQMPGWMFELETRVRERIQDLLGVQDVGLGRSSKGDTLGEVQLLNQNTRLRVAMQEVALLVWLQQIAYGHAELLQQHYQPERWVGYLGDSAEAQVGTLQWTQALASTKFDLNIQLTSTQPYDEQREIAKYLKAADIVGAPIFEELLKKIGIPKVDEIIAKHGLLAPIEQLIEIGQQAGIPTEQLIAAIEQVINSVGVAQEQQKADAQPAQ